MNLSKKELIVVALFLNLGVLTLIISLSTTREGESFKQEEPFVKTTRVADSAPEVDAKREKDIMPLPPKETKADSFDEIDQLLEEYLPLDEALGSKLNKENACNNESSSKKEVPPTAPRLPIPLKKTPVTAPPAKKNTQIKEEKKALPSPSVNTKPVEKIKESQGDTFYTVQPGDNPWKIAKKFHISFEKLLELNNLNEKRARNLKVGERLKIHEER